jgi:hypothetical protein
VAAKTYLDFLAAFDAGVNGGIEPLLLPKNQLARAENATVRGAYISHRPPKMKRNFIFASPTDQATVEGGLFQGGGYYRPDYGTEQLIAQISGHLFSFTEIGGSFTVADISVVGDLNSATVAKAWMLQAEKWLIVNDGSGALPIFYDGTTSRRSYGDSVPLGVNTSAALFPATRVIGEVITVTLVSNYIGPFNVPVIFNSEFYETIQSIGGGNTVILTNVTGTPGAVMPIGSQIIVNPSVIGSIVTTKAGGPNFQAINGVEVTAVGGLSINDVITIDGCHVYVGMGAYTVGSDNFKVLGIYTNTTPPTIDIKPLTYGVYGVTVIAGSSIQATGGGINFIIGNTTAVFTVPAVGSTVTVTIDRIYTNTNNQTAFIGTDRYTLVASVAPSGGSTTLYLQNLTDTADAGAAMPTGSHAGDILSVPELPAGRMGAYGQGRVWYSGIDGITFGAGDIVGGGAGTVANDYRDSVLKTTEQTFLPGSGTFRLPTSGDIITAMIFPAVLDNSLGQGPLQIGTANSMFSVNLPADRSTWTAVQLILPASLVGKGPLGQDSTIIDNSDIIFREYDGLGSLIQARRDFVSSGSVGGGNTPISREVSYIFDDDDQTLLSVGSAIPFDNRDLHVYDPAQTASGVVHSGLVAMSFDTVSNLRTKLPAVYEGAWTDLNILQVVCGKVNGTRRAFAFTRNKTTNLIELVEYLYSADPQTLDNGTDRISWNFDTPVIFNKDIKPLNELAKLADGEIYTKDISGTVDIEVQYRPDFNPIWTTWRKFTVDPTTWKPRMGLGEPSSDDCEVQGERQMRVGYFFQLRVIVTGTIKFMGMRVQATSEPEAPFARPICAAP